MTTEIDPIRWTESNDAAPECLRAPFAAATKEGPSAAQMRMLALKLAAVSTGTAVAASSATAHASSTLGGGAAASSALPLAKIVIAMAVVGASALGGVVFFAQPPAARQARPPVSQAEAPAADTRSPSPSAPSAPVPPAEQALPVPAEAVPEVAPLAAPQAASDEPSQPALVPATPRKAMRAAAPRSIRSTSMRATESAAAPEEAHDVARKADVPSEVELLRRARTALSSTPREAFALTEQHREHYPRGVFAQERDALAIEALLRAGDTAAARGLAQSFIRAHPTSPHAHRFRETLGLR